MKPTLQLVISIVISLGMHFWHNYNADLKIPIASCQEFTDEYKDKITGVKRFIAKEKIKLRDHEGKNTFDLVWFKTNEEYTIAFKAKNKLCFDNDVAVSFHLLQGKVITCPSAHIANCESLMTVNFNKKNLEDHKLDLISSSEVVGISFENEGKLYKLKVNPNQSITFKQTLQCLSQNK